MNTSLCSREQRDYFDTRGKQKLGLMALLIAVRDVAKDPKLETPRAAESMAWLENKTDSLFSADLAVELVGGDTAGGYDNLLKSVRSDPKALQGLLEYAYQAFDSALNHDDEAEARVSEYRAMAQSH